MIFEGGNVKIGDKQAQKIPVKEIGLKKFQNDFKQLLKELNKIFKKEYGYYIWDDEKIIDTGVVFNGSTSILMNPEYLKKEKELLKLKSTSGDIDITVPNQKANDVDNFLNNFKGKINNFEYIGCKGSKNDQTITLWKYCYEKNNCVYSQIDFEYLPYEGNLPSSFAKFSHSSSFDDLKEGIKGVFHKYLLRSIARVVSKLDDDILIATKSSTCDNIRISKAKRSNPHYLKFSILRGLRVAFEPMICNGKQVYIDGKPVYKEIDTKKSHYVTDPNEIFTLLINKEIKKSEEKDLWSYVGLLKLMKKYLDKNQIEDIFKSFFGLLYEIKGGKNISQQLERDRPEIDKQVKLTAINRFVKEFPFVKKYVDEDLINQYYKNYFKSSDKVFAESIFKEAYLETIMLKRIN